MDAINLNRLAYFTAVVEAGSFTKAADRLGITKAVVSQQVSRLEDELHTSLLVRTTRRVEPTDAGRLLHARGTLILQEAQDAFDELAQSNIAPAGFLRIAAPNDYGTDIVAPLAAAFARRYPACEVELVLSDQRVDLIADHIDLSIRVGWLEDSGLQARHIADFSQYAVAAPTLGAAMDAVEPQSLAEVPFIANGALRDPLVLRFDRGGFDRQTVRMRPSLSMNTTPAVLAATLAGGGFSVLPDFLVVEHLKDGRLVRLLPDWSLPGGGIHVVYPPMRFRPPKVTTFVAMLIERLRNRPDLG